MKNKMINITNKQQQTVVQIFNFANTVLNIFNDVQGIILPYTNDLSNQISTSEKNKLLSIIDNFINVQFPIFQKKCNEVDLNFEVPPSTSFDTLVKEFNFNIIVYQSKLLGLKDNIEPKKGLFSFNGDRTRTFENYYKNVRLLREILADMIYICTLVDGLSKIDDNT